MLVKFLFDKCSEICSNKNWVGKVFKLSLSKKEPRGSGLSEALHHTIPGMVSFSDAFFLVFKSPFRLGEIVAYVQVYLKLKAMIVITCDMISELPGRLCVRGDFLY